MDRQREIERRETERSETEREEMKRETDIETDTERR